jgi:hypothetical protein
LFDPKFALTPREAIAHKTACEYKVFQLNNGAQFADYYTMRPVIKKFRLIFKVVEQDHVVGTSL